VIEMHEILHAIVHSIIILPFLYLAYLLMELLEHKAGDKFKANLAADRRTGPVLGAFFGMIPLCGLSDLGAGLYAGKVISLGTLVALFVSTSGEAAFIAAGHPEKLLSLFFLFLLKLAIAGIFGFIIDFCLRNKQPEIHIHDLCEEDHCNCEHSNMWRAALAHAAPMFGLVLVVNLVIALLEMFGIMEAIGSIVQTLPALGVLFSAVIGFIPGCASIVLLISLWCEGILSSAALLAGLITSAGTGYLVLFNTNKNVKQNIFIVTMVLMLAISIGGFFEITDLFVKLGV
jgi:hypothetical protein